MADQTTTCCPKKWQYYRVSQRVKSNNKTQTKNFMVKTQNHVAKPKDRIVKPLKKKIIKLQLASAIDQLESIIWEHETRESMIRAIEEILQEVENQDRYELPQEVENREEVKNQVHQEVEKLLQEVKNTLLQEVENKVPQEVEYTVPQ
jgi:hypothetical protein